MDDRIVEFVRGLRAGGVPVSTAEEIDALTAVGLIGVGDKPLFASLLKTTLIKHIADREIFDELFPIYFSAGELALQNALESLSAADENLLKKALSGFDERLQQLLEWLTQGGGPTAEQLEELMEQSGIRWANSPGSGVWVTRRMLQQMGFSQLESRLQELAQRLRELGMADETIGRVLGVVEVNREQLTEYVAEQVQLEISRRRAERPRDIQGPDLMQKSFHALSAADVAALRSEIRRIVNQLKTRAALRRKKGVRGRFDPRTTIRQNLRYGGVPLEIYHKKKKLKPDIILIFDVSRSMQTIIEFLLHFVLEMQDQVSRLRSYAYYDNLGEVTDIIKKADSRALDQAFQHVQQGIPGHLWRTNLGYSLHTFFQDHLSVVTQRSTVIVIGDGRNNFADPRLDLVTQLQKRARKLVWFTPENQQIWGSGDSDMDRYAPLCDEVYQIRNLAQLATAIDRVFIE